MVVEPSAVVAFAALLKNKELFTGKRVGVIFSGGNVELKKLGEWFWIYTRTQSLFRSGTCFFESGFINSYKLQIKLCFFSKLH